MFDFFGELKRILVSLTEVASLVQHVNCDEGASSSSSGASSTHNDEMDTEDIEIHVSFSNSFLISSVHLSWSSPLPSVQEVQFQFHTMLLAIRFASECTFALTNLCHVRGIGSITLKYTRHVGL